MIPIHLQQIIIESDVAGTEVAHAVRRNAGRIQVAEQPAGEADRRLRRLGAAEGKRVLLVRRFQGRVLKQCQGFKPRYSCCNLHTLSDGNHCSMECAYCILQYYMTSPHLSVFANTSELQEEISREVGASPERVFRITTGELSDSLLLDPLTEGSRRWVPFFRRLPNAVLELKTKTDHVEHLLDLEPGERTVVSWSVNPPEVVQTEEFRTAGLAERLAAARRVARHGYPVGFHLDPMVHFPGWQEGYARLLDLMLEAVSPERIAWISLGSLRFPPEMKAAMAARFPRSRLRFGEMVSSGDGKMRYLRPLRLEMFRAAVEHLRDRLRDCASAPLIYLCMESPEVWKRVFGALGPTPVELDRRFAESYRRRFPGSGLPPPS